MAIVTMNNPEHLNALDDEMLEDLSDVFEEMMKDRDVWGVILTGTGKSFVSGGDLKKDYALISSRSPEPKRAKFKKVDDLFNRIAEFDRPVIAAINGYALGGGAELALCCDIRIAGSGARIGFPETGLGGIPVYGSPTRLPRIIGMNYAKEMLLLGDIFTAEECLRMGFVTKVTDPEMLMEEAEKMMCRILRKSPPAVKYLKILLNKGAEMSYHSSLEMERMTNGILAGTEDYYEGLRAVSEKRNPVYSNR